MPDSNTEPATPSTEEIARAMAAHFGLTGAAQDAAVENIMRFARCVAREQRYAAVDAVNAIEREFDRDLAGVRVERRNAASIVQNAQFPKNLRANVAYFTS
jgi:hypothetical protein